MIKNILQFINSSYWLRSGLYAMAQRLSTALFGIAGFLILVRVLPKQAMGSWALYLTISTLLEVVRAGLIKNALVKYSTDFPEERRIIEGSSLALNIASGLISGGLLALASEPIAHYLNDPDLASPFRIHFAASLFLVAFQHLEFVQIAKMDFKGIFLGYFVRQGSFFLFLGLHWLLQEAPPSLSELAIYQLFGIIGGTAASYASSRRYLIGRLRYSRIWLEKLWKYGRFVFATNVSSMLFRSTDQLMIGYFLSPVAVAAYNAAVRVTNLIDLPAHTVSDMVFPKSVKAIQEQGTKGVKLLYEQSVGMILAMYLPLGLFIWLFPEWVVQVIAGEQYAEAAPILQITVISGLFLPFLRQYGTMMDAIGKPNYNFYLLVFIALLNALLNYFAIQQWGTIGAAQATLATYVIGFFASQYILNKQIEVQTWQVVLRIASSYLIILNMLKKIR